MPHQLAAFYQCHREPKSFLRALGSFRYHYPRGTVKLISDGGLNFKKAAECFGCGYDPAEKISHSGTYFKTPEQLIKWLSRLVEACNQMTEEYVIILEDDVRILNPVNSPLSSDLNGVNENAKLGETLTAFLKTKNNTMPESPDHYYGGCGGSILRRKFVVEKLQDHKSVLSAINEIKQYAWPNEYPSDYYLSALVLYFGGSIRQYDGYYEKPWPDYRDRLAMGKIEVLHQEKSLYHEPLEAWEAAILGLPVNW